MLALSRVMLEHLAHGGAENGSLKVTHADLAAYGVPDGRQAEAIREAVALGFLHVVEQGGRCFGSAKRASRYRLTWLPVRTDETTWPATNEWKAIKSAEDARVALEGLKKRDKPEPKRLRDAA